MRTSPLTIAVAAGILGAAGLAVQAVHADDGSKYDTDLEIVALDRHTASFKALVVDSDGDGWTDWVERLEGTDPNDPASHPQAVRTDLIDGSLYVQSSVFPDRFVVIDIATLPEELGISIEKGGIDALADLVGQLTGQTTLGKFVSEMTSSDLLGEWTGQLDGILADAAKHMAKDDPTMGARTGGTLVSLIAAGMPGMQGSKDNSFIKMELDGGDVKTTVTTTDLDSTGTGNAYVKEYVNGSLTSSSIISYVNGVAVYGTKTDASGKPIDGAVVPLSSTPASTPATTPATTPNTTPATTPTTDWCVSALGAAQLASRSLRHNVLQLAEYRRLGLVHYEAPTRSRMLADLIALGRYREALEQAEACLDLHEMIGGLHQSAIHADLALLTAVLGDVAQASEALANATQSVLGSTDNIDTVGAMARLAQVAVLGGAWSAAAEWAERAGTVADRVGLGSSDVFAHRIDGVEALIQLDRSEEVEHLLGALEAVNARSRLPRGAADGARGRALVAAARGDTEAALAFGRAAVDAYRAGEFPLESARALQFVGVTLRRAGKRAEAADALGQARQLFERIEAPSLVARADAEIERLGAKRSTDSTTLTPTEQQVADLVVAGRSNAEIAATLVVSLRTVESNLTRAYRKLGVRSRTELAALLRER